MAKQANGGPGSIRRFHRLLVTAVTSPTFARDRRFSPHGGYLRKDFSPAAKIPGALQAGRTAERKGSLTARDIYWPISFPKGYSDEVQIIATVLSAIWKTNRISWPLPGPRRPWSLRYPLCGSHRRHPYRPVAGKLTAIPLRSKPRARRPRPGRRRQPRCGGHGRKEAPISSPRKFSFKPLNSPTNPFRNSSICSSN